MNAPAPFVDAASPGCRTLALAALGALLPEPGEAAAEARFLREAWLQAGGAAWPQQVARALAGPLPADLPLSRLAALLQLGAPELLAVALVAAVEDDPVVGRVLAWLQGGAPRPSLALLARAFAPLEPVAGSDAQAEALLIHRLAGSAALRAGALRLDGEERPLCERTLAMPAPIAAALAGLAADWPGQAPPLPAPAEVVDAAAVQRWAARLAAGGDAALLIRCSSPAEAQAVAVALCAQLQRRPAWFGADLPAGADLWLALGDALPVFSLPTAPLELQVVPALQHYRGPLLVLAAPDGGVRRDDGVLAEWRVPRADLQSRRRLWQAALGDTPLAERAARRHRGSAAQVAEQARLVRLLAAGESGADDAAVAEAARLTAACRALDALAERLPQPVDEGLLVLGEGLQAELQRVRQRCEQREGLADALGAALRTRAVDGVRMLFTGGSGTGKTLAAQWLATVLALPLYRVDLSAMLSKWVGETEKNLAELLARAEAADVLLLFDEADTLFGKRTEVASANDRFANAQTNYLLQRIESHGGIVVLTSNSRSRFDPAFVRRLDFIVDFAAPDAAARRALWQAHLGSAAALDDAQLNRLAAQADLAGGHIRNAVLAAAALAAARGGPIVAADLAAGVRAEYRKLGRTAPLEL